MNNRGIVTSEKGYKLAIQRVEKEAVNNHFSMIGLSISTLFEKIKNVEFLSLFERENVNTQFKIDYNQLFEDVKKLKKQLE